MLEASLLLIALTVALGLRPWRLLTSRMPPTPPQEARLSPLWSPLFGTLVILPWIWALPTLHHMPLQLQYSGACLVLMMLGWPLTIPTLTAVGVVAACLSPTLPWDEVLRMIVWHGVVPATLGLLWGAGLRRWLGTKVFVYLFGRGFVGTVLCLFAAAWLRAALGHELPGVHQELSHIARWLMAWGDAVLTGMLCAIFVAYRPQWLATWSDALYLHES